MCYTGNTYTYKWFDEALSLGSGDTMSHTYSDKDKYAVINVQNNYAAFFASKRDADKYAKEQIDVYEKNKYIVAELLSLTRRDTPPVITEQL